MCSSIEGVEAIYTEKKEGLLDDIIKECFPVFKPSAEMCMSGCKVKKVRRYWCVHRFVHTSHENEKIDVSLVGVDMGDYNRFICVCVCVCVIHCRGRLLVTQPAFPYGASSEFIDRSSGRAETTSHTTHRDSEATTPRVTSRTNLLLVNRG